eukprot:g1598.t1
MYISKAVAQYDPHGSGRDLHMDIRRTAATSPHTGAIKGNPFARPAPDGRRFRAPMCARSDPPPPYHPSGSGRDMFHCPASSNPLIVRDNASKSPFRDGLDAPRSPVVYLQDAHGTPPSRSATAVARRRAARRLRITQRTQSERLARPKSRVRKHDPTHHGRERHTIFSNNRMLSSFALGCPVH